MSASLAGSLLISILGLILCKASDPLSAQVCNLYSVCVCADLVVAAAAAIMRHKHREITKQVSFLADPIH